MSTYADQIAAFTAQRGEKADRQKSIMDEAAEKGETLDAEQQEDFDTLQTEIEAIDKHLNRLRIVEKQAAVTAVPALGHSIEEGSNARGGERVIVKQQPKLEKGEEFARLFKSMAMAKGDVGRAMNIAKNRYGEDSNAVGHLHKMWERGVDVLGWDGQEKANVVAGSTISGTWAADLVLDEGGVFSDFAEYLRPATILGKFGVNGIPSLRRIPFRTALGISTSGGAGYWVGEGAAKPLTSFNFDKTFLEPLKCANIAVLTQELVRSNSVSAENIIRDELRNALVALIDTAFIDPSNSGSSNVKPASITNGADSIAASAGGDADDIRLDIRSLVQKFVNANAEGTEIVLIMRTGDALAAGMLTNALGQPEFAQIGMNGGTIMPGLSIVTSQAVPSGNVVAVQPSEIYFADDGGFLIDMSTEASLLMTTDANSNMDSVTPTDSQVVSMFQTNSVAFRCERILNWARRRTTAVTYLTGAAWGGAVNT